MNIGTAQPSSRAVITCARHPDADADYHCSRCEAGYCEECVTKKPYGPAVMTLCAICRNPIVDLAPTKPLRPFWRDAGHFLVFPFTGNGWVLFLTWPLAGMLLRIGPDAVLSDPLMSGLGAVFPVALYGIYFSLLAAAGSKLAALGEQGKLAMPAAAVFDNFLASFGKPVWNFLGAILSAFWPLFVLPAALWVVFGQGIFEVYDAMRTYLAIAVSAVPALFGMITLPMALLVMAVTENLKVVQDPRFLVAEVRKAPKEYFILAAMFWFPIGLYAVAHYFMVEFLWKSNSWPYLLHFALDSDLHLYLFMFLGHLLGYAAYQFRYKLHWWPDTRIEPFFWVGGRKVKLSWQYEPPETGPTTAILAPLEAVEHKAPAAPAPDAKKFDLALNESLRDLVAEAAYLADHGSYKRDREIFQEVLAKDPDHFEALRGVVMCSFRLEDHDTVKEYARRVAAELGREYAWEALWDMHQDYQRTLPDFSFGPAELMGLGNWLAGRELYLDAARVYRELGVSHPDNALAAEALYRCADLLSGPCEKPDTARKVWEALVKRYPESDFAKQAPKKLEGCEG